MSLFFISINCNIKVELYCKQNIIIKYVYKTIREPMKVISKQPDYYDYIYSNIETETDDKTVFYKRKEVAQRSFIDESASPANRLKSFLDNKLPKEEEEEYLQKFIKYNALLVQSLRKKEIFVNFDLYSNTIYSQYKYDVSKDRKEFKTYDVKILFIAGKTTVLFDINSYQVLDKGYRTQSLHKNITYDECKEVILKDMQKEMFKHYFSIYKDLNSFDCTDMLIQMDMPIIAVELGLNYKYIRFNPNLKKYDYENIENAHLIHQRLEQFISQQLTKRDIVEEVPNELKILNHGFDKKKSFRHR